MSDEPAVVGAAWACAAVAWVIFAFVGGGSINMAVGITLAALFVTVVQWVIER